MRYKGISKCVYMYSINELKICIHVSSMVTVHYNNYIVHAVMDILLQTANDEPHKQHINRGSSVHVHAHKGLPTMIMTAMNRLVKMKWPKKRNTIVKTSLPV